MNGVHDAERLKELQALPLSRKIQITQTRIIEWYQHYEGNVCVSFSGGKDSTVLMHIARQIYPDIPAVFSNTGLEYPEIQRFVRAFDNVDIVTPAMRFDEVISTYGYPLIGKEVAEAIHYARKLSSQSVQVERESTAAHRPYGATNRKREELLGNRPSGNGWKWGGNGQPHQDGVSEKQTDDPSREMGRNRGSRRTGVVTKCQFNKDKWLPLVYTPIPISHYCCFKMKKSPMKKYQHEHGYYPILATLAEESRIRKQGWIRHGCNAFESANPISQPMSFWTEQDVLAYIVKYGVEIASVYGDIVTTDKSGIDYPPIDLCGNIQPNLRCTGCQRTGCIFCAFGFHLEKGETRFQRIARTHPRQYEYSIEGGQWADNPHYDPAAPKMDGEWENWNPKKIWIPSKKGLGLGKVFDMVNEIYGKDFYRYK